MAQKIGKWALVATRLDEIEQWLEAGLQENQIYPRLGIGKTTWEKYKREHAELAALLKKGKEAKNAAVRESLYKQATGYYYWEEKEYKLKDSEGNESLDKISVKKWKPAETGAIAFWLKNRDKPNWMDNPHAIDLKIEELKLRKQELENKLTGF